MVHCKFGIVRKEARLEGGVCVCGGRGGRKEAYTFEPA